MQKITKTEAKAAAKKYYKKGLLTAQHPDIHMREAVFKLGKYRCAVGAVLNKTTLKHVQELEYNGDCPATLIMAELIKCEQKTRTYLDELQVTHDTWCHNSKDCSDEDVLFDDENEFRELIGLKPKKEKED